MEYGAIAIFGGTTTSISKHIANICNAAGIPYFDTRCEIGLEKLSGDLVISLCPFKTINNVRLSSMK